MEFYVAQRTHSCGFSASSLKKENCSIDSYHHCFMISVCFNHKKKMAVTALVIESQITDTSFITEKSNVQSFILRNCSDLPVLLGMR